jgi:hypothetical protein
MVPSTQLVTKNGVREIGSLSGQRTWLQNFSGIWEEAYIHHYGRSTVHRVTLRLDTRSKVILTGGTQKWVRYDGPPASTFELEIGDILVAENKNLWAVVSVIPTSQPEETYGVISPADAVLTGDGFFAVPRR